MEIRRARDGAGRTKTVGDEEREKSRGGQSKVSVCVVLFYLNGVGQNHRRSPGFIGN